MKRPFMFFWAVLMMICVTAVTLHATPSSPSGGNSIYLPILLKPENLAASRRINVLYDTNTSAPRRSIFWFGRVDPTSNYADARLVYDNTKLYIMLHIFDRHTWYDTTPTSNSLTEWDAVTVYLDLDGNVGNTPDSDSYRFVAQLNNPPQSRTNYQTAYQGNGTGWAQANVSFESVAGWVGGPPGSAVNNNNADDRGWLVSFEIPFASLGLAGRPPDGAIWGLSTVVHDRDTSNGTPEIADQVWPENSNGSQPATWGQLHIGLPAYASSATPQGTTTIIHGQNGAVVTDAQVGGYFDCGEPYNPDFFNGWGDANHYGRPNLNQVNMQNQANLGDWPCFSKTYITFPISQIPANKQIISASLTLNHFGNSNPALAQDSLIHVMTIGENWVEQTITWNNAPLAVENIAITRVPPLPACPPDCQVVPRTWDISRAVAQAYEAGQPLRLAIYSTDSAMHSGKYFYSSDADLAGRPIMEVTWGRVSGKP